MPAGQTVSMPSPTGGWNTRDPLDQMSPQDAIQLDNFFPDTGSVALRKGCVEFCDTGEADPVGTLFPYSGGGTQNLLAAVAGSIYDITGGTPTSLDSGYNSDVWSWTNHSTSGTPRIIAANDSGSDVPWVYDGATVTPVAVTGVTDTNLSQVMLFAQRVFYVERNTLSVWYTTVGAFQGALTEFDFGPLCKRGGTINALGTWTRDNGAGGADDLFVVVTTEGEVLLYSGIDPATADDWVLQGVFTVGKPIPGPRCLVNTGPDLVLICADGVQPLSEYLIYGSTRASDTQLARKIANAAQSAVADYGALAGWQGITYGLASMLLINVPQTETTAYQYVANTTTGAWCRFKGWNAYCWAVHDDALFFGAADGLVFQAWTGTIDDVSDIVGEIVTSYQYVGGSGANKRFTLCRPVLQVDGRLVYSLGINVDYSNTGYLPTVSSNTPSGAVWGTSLWGGAAWGSGSLSLQRSWSGVSGIGYAAAVHMLVSTQTMTVKVNSFDLMYERGWAI